MTEHEKLAGELFMEHAYNCAQALACAFADELPLSKDEIRRLSASFGGGMGRLREVCGALSMGFLVLGWRYGDYDVADPQKKAEHYARVQKLARQFRDVTGSIYCRDIQPNPSTDPMPDARTAEYYRKRPCRGYCELVARLLDEWQED